jgi:hypothetical protein
MFTFAIAGVRPMDGIIFMLVQVLGALAASYTANFLFHIPVSEEVRAIDRLVAIYKADLWFAQPVMALRIDGFQLDRSSFFSSTRQLYARLIPLFCYGTKEEIVGLIRM